LVLCAPARSQARCWGLPRADRYRQRSRIFVGGMPQALTPVRHVATRLRCRSSVQLPHIGYLLIRASRKPNLVRRIGQARRPAGPVAASGSVCGTPTSCWMSSSRCTTGSRRRPAQHSRLSRSGCSTRKPGDQISLGRVSSGTYTPMSGTYRDRAHAAPRRCRIDPLEIKAPLRGAAAGGAGAPSSPGHQHRD
jgi:hypothetical protein